MKVTNRNWMVLYTRSRWEKKVDKSLTDQNIDSFCPLVKSNRQWVDRVKMVELPLFNSYIFINATPLELNKAIQTNGVLTYISQGGKPAVIKDIEIERIREIVNNYTNIETMCWSDLNVGDSVEVKDGLLANHRGEIRQIHGRSVLMVIENLNCALTVKIDQKNLIRPTMITA